MLLTINVEAAQSKQGKSTHARDTAADPRDSTTYCAQQNIRTPYMRAPALFTLCCRYTEGRQQSLCCQAEMLTLPGTQ